MSHPHALSRRLSALFLILTFALTGSPATADEHPAAWGPDIGQPIPHKLGAIDQSGDAVNFSSLSGEKGLAIFFVRSADWCPFCKKQLIEVNGRAADFAERGINVVSVSYDSPAILSEFAAERGLGFRLISDEDSAIIRAFGILNQRYKPGSRGYGIPDPGVVIVDADGTVTSTFAEKSYRDRPSIDTILAAIDTRQQMQ